MTTIFVKKKYDSKRKMKTHVFVSEKASLTQNVFFVVTPTIMESFEKIPKAHLRNILYDSDRVGPARVRNELAGRSPKETTHYVFIDDSIDFNIDKFEMLKKVELPKMITASNVVMLPKLKLLEDTAPLNPRIVKASDSPYFVTAMCIVERNLFDKLGGFDSDTFEFAGGEDIDLGWRAYLEENIKVQLYDFECKHLYSGKNWKERFFRYGKAQRLLFEKHGDVFTPTVEDNKVNKIFMEGFRSSGTEQRILQ